MHSLNASCSEGFFDRKDASVSEPLVVIQRYSEIWKSVIGRARSLYYIAPSQYEYHPSE